MADSGTFDPTELRVSSGADVARHAQECGIDMPAIIEWCTHDSNEQGVALPISAETVARRIANGSAVLVTLRGEFVGCAFAVELANVFGRRYFELSTLFVRLTFRMHHIAEDYLYPAITDMVTQVDGVLLGTTKYEFIIKFGLHRGMIPVHSNTLPRPVRTALCTSVSCYDAGPGGDCLKERVWHPDDAAWKDKENCCVRRLGG